MIRKLAATAIVGTIAVAASVVPANAGQAKTVAVKNNAFAPATVNIKHGGKVVWKWTQGGVPHNVTPAGGGSGSATSSRKGFTYAKTFKKAGTYRYVCTIHASMRMTVKVS